MTVSSFNVFHPEEAQKEVGLWPTPWAEPHFSIYFISLLKSCKLQPIHFPPVFQDMTQIFADSVSAVFNGFALRLLVYSLSSSKAFPLPWPSTGLTCFRNPHQTVSRELGSTEETEQTAMNLDPKETLRQPEKHVWNLQVERGKGCFYISNKMGGIHGI